MTPVGKEVRTYYGLRLSLRDARLFRDTVGFESEEKKVKSSNLSDAAGHDSIYGLDALLQDLKAKYKKYPKLHRYEIGGISVRFGDRVSYNYDCEMTHERLA